jgi:hypothetical protein
MLKDKRIYDEMFSYVSSGQWVSTAGSCPMRNVMIHHHLGLGDHFICNGLVRYLYETIKPSRIYLPTKTRNYVTVARMYLDLPGIIPLRVNKDSDVSKLPERVLCDCEIAVGFSRARRDFDVSFYDSVGIPFSVRWEYSKVTRDRSREEKLEETIGLKHDEKFILVHNVGSIGRFKLKVRSDLRQITVSPLSDCLLDWCSLAEKAEEVHCIDSSFIHLAQSLHVKSGIFHNIRPTNTIFMLCDGWRTVDYR